MRHILQSEWISQLVPEQKNLVEVAVELYEREYSNMEKDGKKLGDYSFIVFPMSKAYEGFLKQKFYQFHLIDKKSFEGRRFRIGRALNPDVSENAKDEYWLYDDLSRMCGSRMSRDLWDTWLTCRNQVFHYFPKEHNVLALETAGSHLLRISAAMKSLIECKLDLEEHESNLNNVYNN